MKRGCIRIINTALVPIHQKKRVSSRESPIITHQAIKVATLNATVEVIGVAGAKNITFSASRTFIVEYAVEVGAFDSTHVKGFLQK